MAFNFGGINSKRKRSDVSEAKECVLSEHITGDGYFIFLVDYVIKSIYLKSLDRDIQKHGITNYLIISSISVDNLAKDSTEDLLARESPWKRYIQFGEYNCEAIMAFGSAVRVVGRSADVIWTDFLDTQFNNPFFIGNSEYLHLPDGIKIFGVAPVESLYQLKYGADCVTWPTRHFWEQLDNMKGNIASKFKFDMRPYEVIYCDEE